MKKTDTYEFDISEKSFQDPTLRRNFGMQTGVLGTRMCCSKFIHTNPSPNPDYGWNLAKSSRQNLARYFESQE
ncbi:hypothetical protein N7489_003593 [Penicillium chrysogenum]|uniref:Uncharacterized protein n=1 Tax=Penicillium chrysogenum TaxID=5076 RepID=A0ABQ8W8Z3_PENCH|nr:uncharacterized protein N7489_003593 [Penicillium chrysogenum]KAJ5253183.1 hypothetical protein N7489_003593 [Penicillium chrysogenum]KAJ5260405.1 hypothetical protein N7505_009786 [Penicillium chrysogenum]KAJ6137016.1 hypothetical protein N7497_012268 [Penicillium chrysogenum]